MNAGKLVFAQLTAHLPLTTFRRCVARYDGEHKTKSFTCLEQFLVMIFAQLTFRESLRDIEACLRAQPEKLYHMGLRSRVELKSNLVYGLHDSGGFFHPADLSLIDSINKLHTGDDVSYLPMAA